jgi:FkbM family methyltransferase
MKLIFDIGYNIGDFARACTKIYNNCKIIGVEANPMLTERYWRTFREQRNLKEKPKNVELINKLVSSESGKQIPFYINAYQHGLSSASVEFMEKSRFTKGSKYIPNPEDSAIFLDPINVETITLDDLIKKHGTPDFIKIDVEGYEQEVVSGLSKSVSLLGLEWHEEDYDSVVNSVNHLISLGFKEFGVIGYFITEIDEKITFHTEGDPFMDFPKNFYSWEELKPSLDKLINPERRVHYGMFYAKK